MALIPPTDTEREMTIAMSIRYHVDEVPRRVQITLRPERLVIREIGRVMVNRPVITGA